ncbi:MAG: carbohydrate-binding domain-containing protein [Eubacteriales bacterium]
MKKLTLLALLLTATLLISMVFVSCDIGTGEKNTNNETTQNVSEPDETTDNVDEINTDETDEETTQDISETNEETTQDISETSEETTQDISGNDETTDNTDENNTEKTSEETTQSEELSLTITCLDGSADCYSIVGNTVTFTSLSEDSVYAISGGLAGNLVIDVGDDYKFELEMHGLTIWCDNTEPVSIISGDEVTLTAKKGYENFIYDLRETVAEDDETQHSAAIYSTVDLCIGGKGSLTIESENNNGIHTKDDLEVKNLTLSVTCVDNALKGNDSVTVESGTLTLIATAGDGIKTSNTDISSKGNQRGTVTISGGTINIYAACDGIDAAYDVLIDETEGTVILNIYTDKYSEYSEEVAVVSEDIRYIRFTNDSYSYSIKYYNSTTGEYEWVNATYFKSVSSGRTTYYYYSLPIAEGYDKFRFFMYSSSQVQGQDTDYTVCSDYLTWNDSCDTFALSQSGSSLKYSWTNYTTSGTGNMGGMQSGNTDKGDHSTKGIKAGNSITIQAGTINIKSYDDAVHANNDDALENGEIPTGDVVIEGGILTIYTNDDGIHADGTLTISGGTVNVTNSYEGLEGTYIKITGGNISVVSSDDGINSTVKTGTGITISGGTVYIYAKGDGLDCNSTTSYSGIAFDGGCTTIICNSSGNSAIDTEAGYKYTGGSVIAVMTSGGMTSESTRCADFSSIATSKTISLTSGSYLTVSKSSDEIVCVKMPCSISSALVIYLGDNSATMSTSTASSVIVDDNGVCWN